MRGRQDSGLGLKLDKALSLEHAERAALVARVVRRADHCAAWQIGQAASGRSERSWRTDGDYPFRSPKQRRRPERADGLNVIHGHALVRGRTRAHLGERAMIEDVRDRVSRFDHDQSDRAGFEIAAIVARSKCGDRSARNGGQRAIESAHDRAHPDLMRRARKSVPSAEWAVGSELSLGNGAPWDRGLPPSACALWLALTANWPRLRRLP